MTMKPEAAQSLAIVLFDGFETLDVFGPVEIFGCLPAIYRLAYYSLGGGTVHSSQGLGVEAARLGELEAPDILLVPGGMGTRTEVENKALMAELVRLGEAAGNVLSVCTGSALIAKAGLLDGRRATSNKRAFAWVKTQGEGVLWVGRARWVRDGKFYTSSGVSAGMDMALGYLADTHGRKAALRVADGIEYLWNEDSIEDPFSVPD
jgi:putative intracellular protease/amidase